MIYYIFNFYNNYYIISHVERLYKILKIIEIYYGLRVYRSITIDLILYRWIQNKLLKFQIPPLFKLIKNVSSSISHKITPSLRLSFRKFKKSLPSTLIYTSILINIYMNANIMNTQISYFVKYDLNGHWRSQNVALMFILTLTYVLKDNFLSLFIRNPEKSYDKKKLKIFRKTQNLWLFM